MTNPIHRQPSSLSLPLSLFLLATSALALSGCMTSAKDVLGISAKEEAIDEQDAPEVVRRPEHEYVDPMVASAADGEDSVASPAGQTAATDPIATGGADLAGRITQPTGVSAGQSSLFSSYAPPAEEEPGLARETPASLIPTGVPQHGYNAASASLFSTPRSAQPDAQMVATQ